MHGDVHRPEHILEENLVPARRQLITDELFEGDRHLPCQLKKRLKRIGNLFALNDYGKEFFFMESIATWSPYIAPSV